MGWIIGLIALFGFLFFLINYPRQILTGIGIIVGVVALLIFVTIYLPEQNRKMIQDKIDIKVAYGINNCGMGGRSLSISIYNGSNKTISKVTWRVDAYQPGYSTNLAGYDNDYYCDKILKPGERWTSCYTVPSTLNAEGKPIGLLQYSISSKNAHYQD
ncbi:MAG: hypothetical protein HY753_08500 [Nitrospirae bacterium]|nr:hypothetical protein [Nitrospirota bacterium]